LHEIVLDASEKLAIEKLAITAQESSMELRKTRANSGKSAQ
jgi:hypothetical protein